MNTNNNKDEIKKELIEFGFMEDQIDLALKITNTKQEAIDM
jgi:hypothetical protein